VKGAYRAQDGETLMKSDGLQQIAHEYRTGSSIWQIRLDPSLFLHHFAGHKKKCCRQEQ
jgi:hypothetical protein